MECSLRIERERASTARTGSHDGIPYACLPACLQERRDLRILRVHPRLAHALALDWRPGLRHVSRTWLRFWGWSHAIDIRSWKPLTHSLATFPQRGLSK